MLKEQDNNSIKAKALNGVKWTAIERISLQTIQFVVGIIVARMVLPSEYGLVGMLAIFISLGDILLTSGFGIALIRLKEKTNVDYSTAFFFNLVIGIFVYVTLFLLAPFISDFYGIELLKDITRIYGVILLLHSLTVVQIAKLTSEMRFRLQFVISFISIICGGITGIVMAYRGYGVWSIVFQSLINALVSVLLLWTLTGWRPIFCFSKQSFNYLFSFGSKMLMTSIIDVVYDNIYALTIGRFYSSQHVGYFTRGQQMINIPQSSISQIVTKVSLPLLTPLQDDNSRLLSAYEKIFRLTLFAVYPFVIYICVFSDSIISILLKDKWMPCVPYLRILSFGALWYPLTLINVNLIIVKGRSNILLKIDIYKKIIGFTIVLITLNIGIYWMCFGTTVYSLCAFIINCHQTKLLLNYGFKEQIRIVIPTLIKVLLMGLTMYYGCSFIHNDYVRLLAGIVIGAFIYIVLCVLTKDVAYSELLKIVKRK